ncbi:MAG: hypothetical protein R6U15_06535 [Candidatus Izemoplasmatales bacterium]
MFINYSTSEHLILKNDKQQFEINHNGDNFLVTDYYNGFQREYDNVWDVVEFFPELIDSQISKLKLFEREAHI